ncbi:probable protein phosphatase 2C 28 [Daucus carota subsp. sativus]|uniref:probable protein phosphatase 2C 28 n=1 Tax=Daucus carota subsp. sativus TaxID=79200 RepID=UPI0007F007FB|nr:PREDICTED: probable protein phosphatase 2C 28 [Daucus carota subsp. sativus]
MGELSKGGRWKTSDDSGDAKVVSRGDAGLAHENDRKYQNRNVTHGFHMVRGKMGHWMEDFIVADNRKVSGYYLGLYAIFDGHSGCDVAKYLQSHLFENILSQMTYHLHSNPRNIMFVKFGDSRAILCRNGKAKGITIDHEPLKEKKQVENRGGFVVKLPGNVPRVDGQLAMTRAFGDKKVKKHITAKPDVIIKKIDKDINFLILASDGLWKVMSNQEACDCICNITNAQEASEQLIKEALLRESRDDISCIVVMFDG